MSKRQDKKLAAITRERDAELLKKSLHMVELWTQGHRILAAGFIFTPNNDFTMSLTDGAKARDLLAKHGIAMRRIDSGGSPEWEFRVTKKS